MASAPVRACGTDDGSRCSGKRSTAFYPIRLSLLEFAAAEESPATPWTRSSRFPQTMLPRRTRPIQAPAPILLCGFLPQNVDRQGAAPRTEADGRTGVRKVHRTIARRSLFKRPAHKGAPLRRPSRDSFRRTRPRLPARAAKAGCSTPRSPNSGPSRPPR